MPLPETVAVPAAGVLLDADIAVPGAADGAVLFAHGSGSGRHSPRNRFVAETLQQAGLATVLVDLLTADEEGYDATTARLRFDIGLLATRLGALADWLAEHPQTMSLPIGVFGASTGAAAALVAAATRPGTVQTIVSRGGRPDLAGDYLPSVRQPTLLVVGERDTPVLELNRWAGQQLGGFVRLEVVPGATHLFEEPGTLEIVARLAAEWFEEHLGRGEGTTG